MQRYFLENAYDENQATYHVTGEPYHHMIHVMRMKVADQVYLSFTNQVSIIAEIQAISEEAVTLTALSIETSEKELPVAITIASGFPKGDKLEWIVQKGTELGAHAFIGFPAQASVVKWDAKKLAKKQARLQKIAQEAAEQAHRQVCPTIELYTAMTELFANVPNYDQVLVAYEEAAKVGERAQLVQTLSAMKPGQTLLVIFGPEGGLSPKEIAELEALGATCCGLGPRILRTETAPLYLLSATSFHFEL